jgi:hypothetical protein
MRERGLTTMREKCPLASLYRDIFYFITFFITQLIYVVNIYAHVLYNIVFLNFL